MHRWKMKRTITACILAVATFATQIPQTVRAEGIISAASVIELTEENKEIENASVDMNPNVEDVADNVCTDESILSESAESIEQNGDGTNIESIGAVSRTNEENVKRAIWNYAHPKEGLPAKTTFYADGYSCGSCHAFCCEVWMAIFGCHTKSRCVIGGQSAAQYDWNNFRNYIINNARPGDILRVAGGVPHSMVIYQVNSDSVEYYESGGGHQYNYNVRRSIDSYDWMLKRFHGNGNNDWGNTHYYLYQIDDSIYQKVGGGVKESANVDFCYITNGQTFSEFQTFWAKKLDGGSNSTATFYIDDKAVTGNLSPDEKNCFHVDIDTRHYTNGSHKVSILYSSSNGNDGDVRNVVFSNTIPAPASIALNDRKVIISGENTIYYSIDGGKFKTYSSSAPYQFDKAGNHTVCAYCQNDKGVKSAEKSASFYIDYAPLPTIVPEETASSTIITMSKAKTASRIFYSINGGSYKEYTSKFTVTQTSTIKYYATMSGCVNSSEAEYKVVLSAPKTPGVKLKNSTTKIPVGDMIMIEMSRTARTSEYVCTIKKDGTLYRTVRGSENNLSFTIDEPGKYSAVGKTVNSFGESGESSAVQFEVMPNVTVSFVDWDGTVLKEPCTVKYGGSVEAPKAPSREGYDFQGWSGKYENVTADSIVTPKYEIKKFNVIFKNEDGTEISTQKINWGEKAQAPDMTAYIPAAGYKFAGWCVDQNSECNDMDCVKGNMTLHASYAWSNSNFAAAINDLKVVCDSNQQGQYYKATMNLVCNPDHDMIGRIVLQLKTAKGTTVATHVENINLSSGSTTTPVSIQINTNKDASRATVYMVGQLDNEKTAGMIAETVDAEVTRQIYYSDWSEWSTSKPNADNIEEKTQYRYNTREVVTRNDTKTLSGYTLISTTPKEGNWSGWSDTPVDKVNNASLKRDVETRQIIDNTYYTYYHYCTGRIQGAYTWTDITNNTRNPIFNANCSYHAYTNVSDMDTSFAYIGYDSDPHVPCWERYENGKRITCCNYCYKWYRSDPYYSYKTQYRYKDTTYTYKFEKISPFGEWSDKDPKQGSYYTKESRVVYRGRNKIPVAQWVEKDETETINISGNIEGSDDMSGLNATVFVYKKTNTDPTESQIEHLQSITIGESNSYSLSILPKENPSADTGDFVVAFAVEGASRLINVDVIEAPKPSYQVSFVANGIVVDTKEVSEHGSVDAPNAPEIPGMRFVKWDATPVNVTEDLIVEAVYEDAQYVLVYVDNMNGTIDMEYAVLNSPITRELPEAPVGYVCNGWDAEIVTGDMIVNAVFSKREYTVIFMDATGKEAVDTKTVAYGGSVIPPSYEYLTAGEGQRIVGWSTDKAWWNVTEDMCVYPIVEYESTASMPYTNLSSMALVHHVYKDGDTCDDYPAVELKSDTPNATIYYRLEYPYMNTSVSDVTESEEELTTSEDPSEDIPIFDECEYAIYERPIEIFEDVTIKAVAVADGKNASEVSEFDITLTEVEGTTDQPVNVTVKFDVNGGKALTDDEATKEVTVGLVYGPLPTPSRNGYRFLGWYTEKVNGDQILSSSIVSNKTTHTLYAHWEKADNPNPDQPTEPDEPEEIQTYKVIFYAEDEKISEEVVERGETVTNIPIMDESFIGWYDDVTDHRWDPTLPIMKNITVYARFKAEEEPEEIDESGRDEGLHVVTIAEEEHVYMVKGQNYAFEARDDDNKVITWKVSESGKGILKITSKYKAKASGITDASIAPDGDTGVYVYDGENETNYRKRYTVHIIDPYLVYVTKNGSDEKVNKIPKTLQILTGKNQELRLATEASSEWQEEYAVSWTSSNENVAKVDDGTIYTFAKGTAKITAYVNGKALACQIKVVDVIVPGKLGDNADVTLAPLQTVSVKFQDTSFKLKNLVWSNSDGEMAASKKKDKVVFYQDDVVRITPAGKLTAVGIGTTTLTATSQDGKTKSFIVTVDKPANAILYMNKGKTKAFKFYNVKNAKVTWEEASDEAFQIVGAMKGGKAKGLDVGVAKIKGVYAPYSFTDDDNRTWGSGITYTATIYVEDPALASGGNVTNINKTGTSGKLTMSKDDTALIQMTGVYQPVVFASSKQSVAFVDESGVVQARSKGKANLVARVNGKKFTIAVTVN